MQIMYVLTFLVALFVLQLTQTRDEATAATVNASIVASHMMTWHRAAHDHCRSTACNGPVNPRTSLPEQLASAPAFLAGRFSSHYDPSSNVLVTYIPATHDRGEANFGTVAAALADIAVGTSSNIGTWSRQRNAVLLNRGAENHMTRTIPFGGILPDRTPLLISRP